MKFKIVPFTYNHPSLKFFVYAALSVMFNSNHRRNSKEFTAVFLFCPLAKQNKRMSHSFASLLIFCDCSLDGTSMERMRYLKHKRHLFGCDLISAPLDCYICVCGVSLEIQAIFEERTSAFHFSFLLSLNHTHTFLIHSDSTLMLKTSATQHLIYGRNAIIFGTI